ncbi:hypothetical protein EDB81DRAFT_818553, partial [Dactylonectria macrodidyma]
MEPVALPEVAPYHDAPPNDDISMSHCPSWVSNPKYPNPRDLELPLDTTWTDLGDGFHLSSPTLQDGVNPPSPDSFESLVGFDTNYRPPDDRPGDIDTFLSGFPSGVDAGRITVYAECWQACLAGLLTPIQSPRAEGARMDADDRNDHVEDELRFYEELLPPRLTLSEDQAIIIFIDDDSFPQGEIDLPPLAPCGENGTQQGQSPDLWLLDPSGDHEIGTQQGESPDDLMADPWSLSSPLGGGETDTWQGDYTQESPDDLMTDPWPLDSPPYDDRSNSSEDATCIDLMAPDDEDDLPLDPPSGGCGVGSPETAIFIDLTGTDDRDEFSELDEDDEFPPLSLLLQRAKRPRGSQF